MLNRYFSSCLNLCILCPCRRRRLIKMAMLVGVMAQTISDILTITLTAIVLFCIATGLQGERRAAGVRTAMELLDGKGRRQCVGTAAVQSCSPAIDTIAARYRHSA
jgi:hypothetical protein